MEDKIVKSLSSDLECIRCKLKSRQIVLEAQSIKVQVACPYCGTFSSKVHSVYQREVQDIPLQDKQTILLLNTRKMFCTNSACNHKTFSERFEFIAPNGRKTKRLVDKILIISSKLSSVSASTLLKADSIKICKSSICDLLKKMPLLVDKSSVTKICVDDFAFRKRYTYGTVMVDLDSHRIIDLLDSRETSKVEEWLKSYPNLQVISRDGAQTYASAASKSHPEALQISDRFHLLKNLSGTVEEYMYKLFPSRLVIPTVSQNLEMQTLYNTRNRTERIRFARKKRSEGYTVNDIALFLHSSVTTINRYLSMSEDEIPEGLENARERQHLEQIQKKQAAIEEVRKLYAEGHSINEITRITGHVTRTVKKYLKDECSLVNGRYDQRMTGKLAPYEQEVIELRSKGFTYTKIHECITQKGYAGTVASLRVFMQKERTHQKSIPEEENTPVEYIPRKTMCQLIYHELESVKGITAEQYEAAIQKYPILGQLYTLLKEFYRIVFSKKSEDLDSWIEKAIQLKIEELDRYINGLKNDLQAVKNAITYPYNNGLAEGTVNKIKLTKRIMYGRNSFPLLKAKLLINEYFYQIN